MNDKNKQVLDWLKSEFPDEEIKNIHISYSKVGEEGDLCNREGCDGIMMYSESENCSCHIFSPCGSCTSVFLYCSKCGFENQ